MSPLVARPLCIASGVGSLIYVVLVIALLALCVGCTSEKMNTADMRSIRLLGEAQAASDLRAGVAGIHVFRAVRADERDASTGLPLRDAGSNAVSPSRAAFVAAYNNALQRLTPKPGCQSSSREDTSILDTLRTGGLGNIADLAGETGAVRRAAPLLSHMTSESDSVLWVQEFALPHGLDVTTLRAVQSLRAARPPDHVPMLVIFMGKGGEKTILTNVEEIPVEWPVAPLLTHNSQQFRLMQTREGKPFEDAVTRILALLDPPMQVRIASRSWDSTIITIIGVRVEGRWRTNVFVNASPADDSDPAGILPVMNEIISTCAGATFVSEFNQDVADRP